MLKPHINIRAALPGDIPDLLRHMRSLAEFLRYISGFNIDELALSGDKAAREIVKRARRQGDVPDLALNDYGVMHDIDTLHDSEAARRFLQSQKTRKEKNRSMQAC